MKKLKLHELEKLQLGKNEMGKAEGGAIPPIKDECFTGEVRHITTIYAGVAPPPIPPIADECFTTDARSSARILAGMPPID